jgi:transposase
VSGSGRRGDQYDGRDHRQPKRQERGKRGISIDPPGYDAGKKIKGKKRHILVNAQGLLLHAIIHAAGIQDCDGGVLLMSTMFGLFPFLLKLYADSGYQGPKFKEGLAAVCKQINVEIVKRCAVGKFVVLPKRWIVERSIAWLNRCRRLAKD